MAMDVPATLKVLKGMLIKVKAEGVRRKYTKFVVRSLRVEVSTDEGSKKSCYAFTDD
jgi:hypothetical protein